jgi:hypothetical protein
MQTITSQSGISHLYERGSYNGRHLTTCGMNLSPVLGPPKEGEPTCQFCHALAVHGNKVRAAIRSMVEDAPVVTLKDRSTRSLLTTEHIAEFAGVTPEDVANVAMCVNGMGWVRPNSDELMVVKGAV